MEHIRHIFFDLDHTLWDFETNSRETLSELLHRFEEQMDFALPFEEFFPVYTEINHGLWKEFRENRISSAQLRHTRFRKAFFHFGLRENHWIDAFGKAYMDLCPTRTALMPFAEETLTGLQEKYPLHLITNGFTTTQHTKLQSANLARFFEQVVTSESAQAKKPDPRIFEFALAAAATHQKESLYIGDNYEADVVGGINAGLDVIYFNPEGKDNPLKVPEISCLSELSDLL